MSVGAESPAAEQPSGRAREIRSAPQRFIETWIDAIGGFLFCVVVPIPFYATGEPFKAGFGAAEQTILATAFAYAVVWYAGRRLDAFPRATLQGNLSYVAPVATFAYAMIAVVLVLLRSDYSRIQLFGSGALAMVWMAAIAQLRARYLTRHYAVVPASLVDALPELGNCKWHSFEDVQLGGVRVDAIVADLGADLTEAQLSALANAAIAGVPVLDRRFILEGLTGRTPLGGLTPNEFGALLPSRQYLLVRRAIEIVFTILCLPLLLPLLAVVAIVVRLDSPGPIFFLQPRVGRRGRVFRMVKFRTMYHGAGGPSFTTTADPRVTRIGGFLRRCRLDELPQLVNVLRGDMSWVGPRPEALTLDQQYVREIPHFALRGIVRPGVTGWAQINQGYAHDHDEMRSKLEYDLYYLKHCSLWLDVVIVLRTFAVIFGGTGAR
ncbi:Sugar transferase involved in LPS biosynthesis (colanic, teichoic acid) [Enhydrobacter aerosaccus]|uniref:Sugar transferase involved in LPS biosynthesis (Colanic, teichoic acid) n=2 Tax=Enhydrobacter aerosaccus TaxID=225324 RepID=A0A1T4T9V8_9HYPH|nr:Sugar transferase involved in LPS biosynthesis (colanic, teichoic acid) [Enhydrobacter aerosaccus]